MDERKANSIIQEFLANGVFTLKVNAAGNSMSPMIKDKDSLVIRAIASKELRLGDIVVFQGGRRLCCHRLIMKYFRSSGYIFVTKSDRVFVTDKLFNEKKLIGKVSCIQKRRITLNLESIFWRMFNRAFGAQHLFMFLIRNRLKALKGRFFKRCFDAA